MTTAQYLNHDPILSSWTTYTYLNLHEVVILRLDQATLFLNFNSNIQNTDLGTLRNEKIEPQRKLWSTISGSKTQIEGFIFKGF